MSRKSHREFVSREKYENMKFKAQKWYEQCEENNQEIEKLTKSNREKTRDNQTLTQQLNKATEEIKQRKECFQELPDADLFDELETENKNYRKTIRGFKKQIKELKEKYTDKLAKKERDIMLKDGKIQQLEEGRKDLKERYQELKEDFREQSRWVHKRRGIQE